MKHRISQLNSEVRQLEHDRDFAKIDIVRLLRNVEALRSKDNNLQHDLLLLGTTVVVSAGSVVVLLLMMFMCFTADLVRPLDRRLF